MRAVLIPPTEDYRTIDVDLGDGEAPLALRYDLPGPTVVAVDLPGGEPVTGRAVVSILWNRRLVIPGSDLAVYVVDADSWAAIRDRPEIRRVVDDTRLAPDERPALHLVVDEAARGVPARRPEPLDANR